MPKKRKRSLSPHDFSDIPDHVDLETFLELYSQKTGQSYHRQGQNNKGKGGVNWCWILRQQISATSLPAPKLEHVFHPTRKWQFDLSWPDHMVACEVDGGVYGRQVVCHHCGQKVMIVRKDGSLVPARLGMRHNTGKGYENDAEKINEAEVLGWLVLRVTAKMIKNGMALDWIQRALATKR